MKIKTSLIALLLLFASITFSNTKKQNGIKIEILKIEMVKSFILLKVENNSSKKINLENDNDIVFAIDQNRRQTFGSFSTSESAARSLNLENYNYNGIIKPGKSKNVYIFFDPRMNFNLNNMRMLVYHLNGQKIKLI